ncbi:MAG: hypothetical protein QOI12_3360 [Alphaproteobacteria bacterium]|jgi:hypothetical protein|nr:hypothetical protein [Alphaproteobacteria bacterium]
MGTFSQFLPPVAAVATALALAGCASSSSSSWSNWGFGGSSQPEPAMVQPLPAPEIPATIRATEVIGRWGYASFHDAKDRPRTEANARGQCSHPYVIGQGPTGGVMMYPADQSQLTELRLKGGPAGKNYIGPAGEPGGGPKDQEILSFDGRVMLLRYVDPEIAGRYGTGVYVRCAPNAGNVAQTGKSKK